ncbi:MAG: LuxR C-terminal-related transcriptional regulator [Chloroflexi bacterium]|nr:LuxR C-terminal-related transcriptional regulator [Chloroflexota bacterium]MCI0579230.1 LuxR C-terminal-related transcriptional regulator [Chloroflexota bacterium]MCI0650048.1 LuxR C-terminal-related transcriptional regulator [Chloroflexota bacterium]MCI0728833.1 LuxR C-terminal-related transcriptional regulator [Chloroflexota bacterium]
MAEKGEPLSERELAVLECLVHGSTNREIARDLDISHNTVKVHLRNIFTKLGVSSRTEAMTAALQKGIVTMPGVAVETVEPSKGLAALRPATEPLLSAGLPDTVEPGPVRVVGEARPARATPWRVVSLALFVVLGLVVAAFAGARLLDGGSSTDATEPAVVGFVDEPIGESRWLTSRPLPRERSNMAVASVGVDLYQIGGEMAAGVVNLVDTYETNTHEWHSATAKPTAVADAPAAVLFGEIYVPGGRLADGRPTSVVEAFSPVNNAWRPVAPLPVPLSGSVALAYEGALYLFGGWDGQDYLARAYRYEPQTDRWQELTPMEQARAFAAGGVLANQLYVVGGFDGQQELAVCEYFDPAAEIWSACPAMLLPRAGAGAAVLINRQLYVIGGGLENPAPYGEMYDLQEETWQQVEMPPNLAGVSAWYYLGVASVETRIYILGGRQDGTISSANYIYAPFIYQTFIPSIGVEE